MSTAPDPRDRAPEGDTSTPEVRRRPRRAVRRGTEHETVWSPTTDDDGEHGSNDDRLRREVPPHW